MRFGAFEEAAAFGDGGEEGEFLIEGYGSGLGDSAHDVDLAAES